MVVIRAIARKIIKTAYFLLLVVIIGRTVGEPYDYINHDFVIKVGQLIYGAGEIGAENIDYTYFYIVFIAIIAIATVMYLVTMKFIKKLRSK